MTKMMKQHITDSHPTVRVFPRTLQEAYPKEYVNQDIITGPHRDPPLSDFAILMAIIAVASFFFYMFSKYIWI
jgi:hypothetical protein